MRKDQLNLSNVPNGPPRLAKGPAHRAALATGGGFVFIAAEPSYERAPGLAPACGAEATATRLDYPARRASNARYGWRQVPGHPVAVHTISRSGAHWRPDRNHRELTRGRFSHSSIAVVSSRHLSGPKPLRARGGRIPPAARYGCPWGSPRSRRASSIQIVRCCLWPIPSVARRGIQAYRRDRSGTANWRDRILQGWCPHGDRYCRAR